jgi:hypothetical protein
MTDLDRQVGKIVGIAEKRKTYSGVDGGRSIIYSFTTSKMLNRVKKMLIMKLPKDADLKLTVLK